jgi:hypothetical protein
MLSIAGKEPLNSRKNQTHGPKNIPFNPFLKVIAASGKKSASNHSIGFLVQ